jgi:hypothetical protein
MTISTQTVQDIARLLEHDNYQNRDAMRQALSNPLFIPRFNLTLDQERDIALERLKFITDRKFVSVRDWETNPLNIFAGNVHLSFYEHRFPFRHYIYANSQTLQIVHEVVGMLDGSTATKVFTMIGLMFTCLTAHIAYR